MGQVTITIDKREYAIACDDGQEAHIIKLSRVLDEKAKLLSSRVGLINENMMLAMIGLLLADEMQDMKSNIKGSVSEENLQVIDAEISGQIDKQADKIINLIQSTKPL